MPLKLELKMGDKVVINGAVIEATGPSSKLIVHNQAAILRGKEIIAEEQAITPATRIYFSLQSAYMFPQYCEKYLTNAHEYLTQYLAACPSARDIVDEINGNIEKNRLYNALKSAQKLVIHQHGILRDFEKQLLDHLEQEESEDNLEIADQEPELGNKK
tara:strand:- start:28 stop:504 length:477 start_codon:yes stop_codon:yes gene_type:complete